MRRQYGAESDRTACHHLHSESKEIVQLKAHLFQRRDQIAFFLAFRDQPVLSAYLQKGREILVKVVTGRFFFASCDGRQPLIHRIDMSGTRCSLRRVYAQQEFEQHQCGFSSDERLVHVTEMQEKLYRKRRFLFGFQGRQCGILIEVEEILCDLPAKLPDGFFP